MEKQKRSIGFKIPEGEYELWKDLAKRDSRSLAMEIRVTMAEKVQEMTRELGRKPRVPAVSLEEL